MTSTAIIIQIRQHEAECRMLPYRQKFRDLYHGVITSPPMQRMMRRACGLPWAEPQTDDMRQMLADLGRSS